MHIVLAIANESIGYNYSSQKVKIGYNKYRMVTTTST